MKKLLCCSLLLMCVAITQAQDVIGRATIDSTEILIGEQTRVVLQLIKPKTTQVAWPTIADTLSSNIQIVSRTPFDTTLNGTMETIRQSYIITSFDSGLYYVPPFPFTVINNGKSDTVYTLSLALNVGTFPVDTTKAYFDIKPPLEVPYTFADFLPWIILILGLLLIASLAYFLIKKFKNTDPSFQTKTISTDPPHVIALNALERIGSEKVWRDGLYKKYYTDITDVLRVYIEDRYGIDAKEMTSHEIVQALKTKKVEKPLMTMLQKLFSTSDLVKFAKVKPSIQENDESLNIATHFVDLTKVEVKKLFDELNNGETDEDEFKG